MRLLAVLVAALLVTPACTSSQDTDRGAPVFKKKKRQKRRPLAATTPIGCGDARLADVPTDPSARGSYTVGLRTVEFAGMTADVYYPAPAGSDAEAPPVTFDLRDHLPAQTAARLEGATLPRVPCACSRDLPLEESAGPYPTVFFFHGRGLTRAEFPTLCTHLASRGFVVISPDLPGVSLADYVTGTSGNRIRALEGFLEALKKPDGALGFLAGHLDGHLGLVGHSLGAGVVDDLLMKYGDVGVAMSGRGLESPRDVSKLVMGGTADAFAPYRGQVYGYEISRGRKRLLGVLGAGHMAFADHCLVARELGGWYGAALAYGLRFDGFLAVLAERGCADAAIPPRQAHEVILGAVTTVLEETLTCSATAGEALEELSDRPDVAELREEGF